jgi:cardiolipin synthase
MDALRVLEIVRDFLAHNWINALIWTSNILALFVMLYVLIRSRKTTSTYAWFLILYTLPWLGLVLFYLFGRDWKLLRQETQNRQQEINKLLEGQFTKQRRLEIDTKSSLIKTLADEDTTKLIKLVQNNSYSVLTPKNQLQIFQDGESKFASLIRDLRLAEKFINVQYFTWMGDELGERIGQILIEKAKQGVEVRLLCDLYGSWPLNLKYFLRLKEAGIKIHPNQHWWDFFRLNNFNYRDHRKIAVIDGIIGYYGGMNVKQEYIDGGEKFPSWKDTHVRVEGPAVSVLQTIFSNSWYLITQEALVAGYTDVIGKEFSKGSAVQLNISGPTYPWESIKQTYFSLITAAKKRIWIQSPYFIPDEVLREALIVAALSGVDVRLMITGVADQKIPYWAASSYYPSLLKAGVRIFQYRAGFLHSKTVVVDDSICSIGTANLDIRSFRINYELNSLIYDEEINQKMAEDFETDLKQCQELNLEWFEKMPLWVKLRDAISGLFSPIL